MGFMSRNRNTSLRIRVSVYFPAADLQLTAKCHLVFRRLSALVRYLPSLKLALIVRLGNMFLLNNFTRTSSLVQKSRAALSDKQGWIPHVGGCHFY